MLILCDIVRQIDFTTITLDLKLRYKKNVYEILHKSSKTQAQ